MTVSYVTAIFGSNTSGTSVAATLTGHAANDIAVAVVVGDVADGDGYTPPTGWTEHAEYDYPTSNWHYALYSKVLDGTEGSQTWSGMVSTGAKCVLALIYRGATAVYADATTEVTGGVATNALPSIAQAYSAGDMLVGFAPWDHGGGGDPAGATFNSMTSRLSGIVSSLGIFSADESLASSGSATPARSVTISATVPAQHAAAAFLLTSAPPVTTRPRLRGGQTIVGELRGGQRWN